MDKRSVTMFTYYTTNTGEMIMAVIKWADQTEITSVNWLWKPFIPFGKVSMLEGNGGDGKTTLMLTIAAMLSRGITPPTLKNGVLDPSETIEPITTFFVTNEDGVGDMTIPRYIRAGGDRSKLAYSGELEHHLTLNEKELYEIINETGARLLIIDPLQSFLPQGINIGNMTQMRSVFSMLTKIAQATDCAIVIIGHLNKNEGARDIHRGIGSVDISAAVRSIILVEADKNDRTKRYARLIKSNYDESDYTPIQLAFDKDKKLYFRIADNIDATKNYGRHERKIDCAADIIQNMLKDSPAAISDIIAECSKHNISDKTTRRAGKDVVNVSTRFVDGIAYWELRDNNEY